MGFFSGIKNTYKKSEAAVVVQNLLEIQTKAGLYNFDPAKLAHKLVEHVWDKKPDIYNGGFGQRPYKLTVAASALANGISLFNNDDLNRNALIISLGNLLSEIEVNGNLYPFNSLDHQVLETAMSIFENISQELSESSLAGEIEEITSTDNYETWDEWYIVFKEVAARSNPQLAINDEGNSVLDFLKHEPLKRAFNDGVEPKMLAKEYAEQFDMKNIV